MKNKKKVFLSLAMSAVMAFGVVGVVACGNNSHKHTYSDQWSSDANNHWHNPTCNDTTEPADLAAHVDANNDGKCDICNHDVSLAHQHTELNAYEFDQTHHWKVCNDCGELSVEKTTHIIENNICTACGVVENGTDGLMYEEIVDDAENVIGYSVLGGTVAADEVFIPSFHNGLRVMEIGSNAFYKMSDTEARNNISSVIIGSGVTEIANAAFYSCNGIKKVKLPATLVDIGTQAFARCSKTIVNEDGSKSYEGLTSLDIPEGCKTIGMGAFSYCRALESITFPDSITEIELDCVINTPFYDNEDNWDGGVLYIGKHLIEAKTDIAGEYSVKEGTIVIAASAFYNCSDITKITLPDSITHIDDYAFNECSALKSISIPEGVVSIDACAFDGCSSLESLVIPSTVTYLGKGILGSCVNLSNVTVAEGNSVYHSAANCIIETDSKTLIAVTKFSIIPQDDSVTTIGVQAFFCVDGLESLTIPSNITTISRRAFYYCKDLTSIVIPESVTVIDEAAFKGCSSLISITIPNGITAIEDSTFSGCTGLTTVNLPASITYIGGSAFYNCKALTAINFGGTAAQWESIEKENTWDRSAGAYSVNCAE